MGHARTQLLPPRHTAGEHNTPSRYCFWLESPNYWPLIISTSTESLKTPPTATVPVWSGGMKWKMKFALWECRKGLTKQSWWGAIKDLPIVDPQRTSFQSPFWMPRVIEHWGIQRHYGDIRQLKHFYWRRLPRWSSEKYLHDKGSTYRPIPSQECNTLIVCSRWSARRLWSRLVMKITERQHVLLH